MSRSGYSEDYCEWSLIRWRGQVAAATRGRRGQKLLLDLYRALDELPSKRLVRNELLTTDGEVCALGALGVARGLDIKPQPPLDPEDEWENDDQHEGLGPLFGVADPLTREIMYMNDDHYDNLTPEARYEKMKAWVLSQILPVPIPGTEELES